MNVPEGSALLAAGATLLIPFAVAGLAAINTGLGRSRNASHFMAASLCAVAVSALAFVIIGFGFEGTAGAPAYLLLIGDRVWNWIAAQPLFLRGLDFTGSVPLLTAWMQLLCVSVTAMIPLGAAAERWRLGAICASSAILGAIIYPLFAHWAWAGGWLAQLGANYGLGQGFVDIGGSGAIHAVGGLTALAMVWILGPRRGKYSYEGMPLAIPGHNGVQVLAGCLLAWTGFLGINISGAILFGGMAPLGSALVAINVTLAASASALMSAMMTRFRFGKPDASFVANGFIAGLAAASAGSAVVPPAAAIVIGLVAGLLTPPAIEQLELRLSIDDPGGAISVHALGGIWGLIAAGIFGRFASPNGQWVAQLIGVATLLGFVLPLSYGMNALLNRFVPQRVSREGERQGMDLYELGAGAYPEFMTHTDEFFQK